jgi:hypothetical protein
VLGAIRATSSISINWARGTESERNARVVVRERISESMVKAISEDFLDILRFRKGEGYNVKEDGLLERSQLRSGSEKRICDLEA